MIIRNFYDDKLAQASYLVGCAATGEAIVIDPSRDIQQYLDMAASQGLRVTAVTETHIHADYLSGSRELAAATGATMYLSDEGDADWKYAFADQPGVVLMKDGHQIKVGNVSLRAIHTPGHTPEHMCFLLTDHPAGETPHSLFSGDFIFAGDVGRPDLLERAANIAGTMEKGARTLFQSIQKTAELPDSLLVWPTHGAGSACGKSLGGSPVTSLGYERKTNWAFLIKSEDKFVDEVLSGQPEPPRYFKMMKALNKQGPEILGALPKVPKLSNPVGRLVDARPGDEIRNGQIKGSLAIPFGKGFTNWAGWLLDYGQPVTLVSCSQSDADKAARDLATIGLDVVAGWIPAEELKGAENVRIPTVVANEIRPDDVVVDIRGTNERNLSHIAGTVHIPLGYLPQRLSELPQGKRIVIHCASGGRTPTAYSILREAGFSEVVDLEGGINSVQQCCPEMIAR